MTIERNGIRYRNSFIQTKVIPFRFIEIVEPNDILDHVVVVCSNVDNFENAQQSLKKKRIVLPPRIMFWMVMIIKAFMVTYILYADATAQILVLFLLLELLHFWMLVKWNISVEENGIRYKNSFAPAKMIPFDSINKVKFEKNPDEPDEFERITLYSQDGKKKFICVRGFRLYRR